MKKLRFMLAGGRLLAGALFLSASSPAFAQGHHAPVTARDLNGAKFNHYYDENGKAVIPPDFTWTFTAAFPSSRAARMTCRTTSSTFSLTA